MSPDFSPWTWSREMPPAPAEDPGAVRRYRRRLVLFVLLMILLTVWFQVHLEPYVTQGVFLSGTLTLWGLWKILQSWFAWGTKGQTSEAARKWLARPVAGELLALGLILITLLLIGTSSIYLHFEGARPGEDGYQVEVLQGDHPFIAGGLKVTSAQSLAGRPFFLRWRSVPLVFRIVNRPGWDPLEVKNFYPGQALHLNVPGAFTRTILLRLVPGKGFLSGDLPLVGEQVPSDTELRLQIGGRPYVLSDLRMQSVVVGGEVKELSRAPGEADRQQLRHNLENYLERIDAMPPDARAKHFDAWEGRPRVVSGVRLTKGAKITIRIYKNQKLIHTQELKVEHDSGIQTRFLEIPL